MPNRIPDEGSWGDAFGPGATAAGHCPCRYHLPRSPLARGGPFPPGQSMTCCGACWARSVVAVRLAYPLVFETGPAASACRHRGRAARAVPDGHTLGIGAMSTLAVNPALLPHLPYDPERDLTRLARCSLARKPWCHPPPPSVPAATLQELVECCGRTPHALRSARASYNAAPRCGTARAQARFGAGARGVSPHGPAMADPGGRGCCRSWSPVASMCAAQAQAGRVRCGVHDGTRAARLPSWAGHAYGRPMKVTPVSRWWAGAGCRAPLHAGMARRDDQLSNQPASGSVLVDRLAALARCRHPGLRKMFFAAFVHTELRVALGSSWGGYGLTPGSPA